MNTFWIVVSTFLASTLIVLVGVFLFLLAWIMEQELEKEKDDQID